MTVKIKASRFAAVPGVLADKHGRGLVPPARGCAVRVLRFRACAHASRRAAGACAVRVRAPPAPRPFSIPVLRGFFVSQAICPSLSGVQAEVKYPVTDPGCGEWQLLSGQLAVVPRNIPERII